MRWYAKRLIFFVGSFFILLPILPFLFLRLRFERECEFIDRVIKDRALTTFLADQVERLELWSVSL